MKKRTKIILGILAALVLLGLVVLLVNLTAKTRNSEPTRIFLPEGTTQDALIDTLHVHGILEEGMNTTVFNFQFSILSSTVRPGSYIISPHMSALSLVRKLRNGQQDPIRLTIGKFRTPEQLNGYLKSKLMHEDFDIPLDSFHLVRPNTYEFYWTVSPEQFMKRMRKEYDKKSENSGKSGLSGYREVIILASIVEEETNHNPEKPLIASVYLNRLKRGIPLQADPTVKYAVGDFTLRRILNKHLAVESPFNTYLHTGLPPAPICLPSDASVDAVLKAPETDYLYFCASDKMDGTHRFAVTLAEHNRNAAAFHRALNALGIR
jgi:UPF0755 protein